MSGKTKTDSSQQEADPQNSGGFILDRRKSDSENGVSANTVIMDDEIASSDKKSQTYSFKRFTKYITANQKAYKKNGKSFCLSRLSILELETVEENYGLEKAKSLDQFVLNKILKLLRKSDRIYAYGLCDFVILMPNTDEIQGPQALQRIVSNLGDISFELENHTIRPSSIYTILDCKKHDDMPALSLLESLDLDINELVLKDLSKKGGKNGASHRNLFFSGSTNEWMKRYHIDDSNGDSLSNLDLALQDDLAVRFKLAGDTWDSQKNVLIKHIEFSESNQKLVESKKGAIVSFLRQLQPLANSSLSSFCDFHLDKSGLYLVYTLPQNPIFVSSTTIYRNSNSLTNSKQLPDIAIEKILLKLTGAFSSLQSLVPPIVLGGFGNMILVIDSDANPSDLYKRMTVLNYETYHVWQLLKDEPVGSSSNQVVIEFVDYAKELIANCFSSCASSLIESLEKVGQENSKYNSFSKLKTLFEDE